MAGSIVLLNQLLDQYRPAEALTVLERHQNINSVVSGETESGESCSAHSTFYSKQNSRTTTYYG